MRLVLVLAFVLSLLLVMPIKAEIGMAVNPEECLGCHSDKISGKSFAMSAHGRNGCTSCHVDTADLAAHMKGKVPQKVKCVSCHTKVTGEHYASVHMLKEISCSVCHSEIHYLTPWKKDKRKAVQKCLTCHEAERQFLESVHGRSVFAGNPDSPACHDCHGLHEIKPLGDRKSFEFRDFHTLVCLKCHSDRSMMARNNVFNLAVETFEESYHGKNYRLGFPERVAGCADCHTSHHVLPAADEKSSVHKKNLVHTCGRCHTKATQNFIKFYPHGEHDDREKYPVLYWTYVLMTCLLLTVFAIFWVHTALWMVRGFVENRRRLVQMQNGAEEVRIEHEHLPFLRFKKKHISLHVMVIVSFLGLSLTGLPMKFNDQQWAKFLMETFGGTEAAGCIHRICAVITFAYFAIAIAMSIHFLFFKKGIKGNWLQRLFGPESLCPSLRDLKDIKGMLLWFLFKGPKPTFDRWTYWEKFDFLAVFWGMFAIGGSGLVLWFPEFFGTYLPGWVFNVATIIHSDEALLATGFIFTVHFFNTHGRPEKYPMDFVIFNGRLSKREFIEERTDQWRRYEEEGNLESLSPKKPSNIFYEFVMMGFAMLAILTGLSLLGLMIYAYLQAGG